MANRFHAEERRETHPHLALALHPHPEKILHGPLHEHRLSLAILLLAVVLIFFTLTPLAPFIPTATLTPSFTVTPTP